jgi:WD40 repeat protein
MRRLWRWTGGSAIGRRALLAVGVAAAWLWWDWAPMRPLTAWTAPEFDTYTLRVSADASTLVTISPPPPVPPGDTWYTTRGPVRLWDMATGRVRACIPHHGDKEAFQRLGPDGGWMLIHGQGAYEDLSLWDPATGRLRAQLRPDGEVRPCFSRISVSPDGRLIAGDRPDGQAAEVWDGAIGRLVAECLGARECFAFTPDCRRLLAATPDVSDKAGWTAKLWDLATGREIFTLPGHHGPIDDVAVSPDGRWLATGARTNWLVYGPGDVKLWDAASGRLVADLQLGDRLDSNGQLLYSIGGLYFSPDSRLLMTRGWGHKLVWDISETPPRNRDDLIAVTEASDGGGESNLYSGNGPWYAPDGHRWFVIGPKGRSLLIADEPISSPRPLALPTVSGVDSQVTFFVDPVFGPDGQTLAVSVRAEVPSYAPGPRGLLDRILRRPTEMESLSVARLYNLATGGTIGTLPAVAHANYEVLTFTPDGRSFWTQRLDESVARSPRGTRLFELWPVPSPGVPWWLFAVTAIGLLLLIFDWHRGRRGRTKRTAPRNHGDANTQPGLPGLDGRDGVAGHGNAPLPVRRRGGREAGQLQGRETKLSHPGAAVAENPVLEHVVDRWSNEWMAG